jgi:hypothetical protein
LVLRVTPISTSIDSVVSVRVFIDTFLLSPGCRWSRLASSSSVECHWLPVTKSVVKLRMGKAIGSIEKKVHSTPNEEAVRTEFSDQGLLARVRYAKGKDAPAATTTAAKRQ